MTSDLVWQKADDGEWIPPSAWLESGAPRSLRLRYEGDRNFDRIVLGSATKPIWAAAVLSVKKNLNQKLCVKGAAGQESDVFGIPVLPSWRILFNSSSLNGKTWCDFQSYLTKSDNRYQAIALRKIDPLVLR